MFLNYSKYSISNPSESIQNFNKRMKRTMNDLTGVIDYLKILMTKKKIIPCCKIN